MCNITKYKNGTFRKIYQAEFQTSLQNIYFYHTMVNIDVVFWRDYMQANYLLLNGGIGCLLGMDCKHDSGVYVVPSVRGSNRNVSRRVIAAGCRGTTEDCRWALSVGEIVAQIPKMFFRL